MHLTEELKAFFAFAESLPTSAALIKREIIKMQLLFVKIGESQN